MTYVGPKNRVLDEGQDQTNPFAAARGDKSTMRLFAKLLVPDCLIAWTVSYELLVFCFYFFLIFLFLCRALDYAGHLVSF